MFLTCFVFVLGWAFFVFVFGRASLKAQQTYGLCGIREGSVSIDIDVGGRSGVWKSFVVGVFFKAEK